MNISLADLARQAATAWVSFVCRRSKAVMAAAVLLTLACGVYFAVAIRVNTDTTDMLDPNLPFRKLSRAVSEAFPQFSDNILVVIEGDTPDLADQAALALGQRLKDRPELFRRVMDHAGDPFFRRNGLLYLSIEDLSDLSDRLARAQPFLGALWRDPSLRGLLAMLDLAIGEIVKNPADVAFEVGSTLDAIADVIAAEAEGKFKQMSWQEIMSGTAAEAKDKRRFLLTQPILDHASLMPAGKAMAELRRLAAEMHLTSEHGVRVRLTGSAALNQEELKAVESSIGMASFLSLGIVAAIVFGGLRSFRMGIAVIVSLLMGLTWTAAIGLALFGEFNLLSVTFVVLFVGLSVDFGIHYCLRYVERLADGEGQHRALIHSASDIGNALFLCAAAAAAGFFAFAPTDYRGPAQLGVVSGIGMFVALVSNMTLIPALIQVLGTRARLAEKGALTTAHASPRAVEFWKAILHVRIPLTVFVAAVAIIGSVIAARTTFDFDPFNLKDPNAESVQTLRDLMNDEQGGRFTATILAKDVEEANALAARLDEVAEVDSTRTLSSFVPKIQETKLAIIAEMALFLTPALEGAVRRDRPPAADVRRDFAKLADRLDALAQAAESESARSAGRLVRLVRTHLLKSPVDDARWQALEQRLLAALPDRLAVLKQALAAAPVAMADIPPDLRAQYLAADGRVRLEVVPRDDLRDREALLRFVQMVRAVVPDVTGTPVVMYESAQAILRAFAEASVIALIAIVVLLYAALRRVSAVALVLVPTALAAILTGVFSVVSGISLNYANVIVVPLLLGVSVAYGIHLVLRGQESHNLAEALASSTPRAMLLSATTTIASFGSIALADHWGMASLGILLTVSTVLALVASLLALPPVMGVARDFIAMRHHRQRSQRLTAKE